MSGYLYAIIFDQNTVKIGMTHGNLKSRMSVHHAEGRRWGAVPKYELTEYFDSKDIEFREMCLMAHCKAKGTAISGNEWFRFGSPESALAELSEIMARIKGNDFGNMAPRRILTETEKSKRFDAAMLLVIAGENPVEAARRVGLRHSSVTQKKEYRDWLLNKTESNNNELKESKR